MIEYGLGILTMLYIGIALNNLVIYMSHCDCWTCKRWHKDIYLAIFLIMVAIPLIIFDWVK